ncbi:kinase-like domain-containing protein [Xylariaceae sp. FL1651]|nr:kinase-like domain-containing protein [Xylariaceae sp. FL1651]
MLARADDGGSVLHVRDLGFSSVPQPIDQDTELLVNIREFRQHLGLDPQVRTSVKQSIREKIKLCIVHDESESNGGGRKFLPIDKLNIILSLAVIKALIREEHPHITAKLLSDKIGRYITRRRILGILLYMHPENLKLLECFDRENVTDDDMPLTQTRSIHESRFRTRGGKENRTMLLGWEDNDITLLYQYQPIFFAPFFAIRQNGFCNYFFNEDIRLPWTKCEYMTRGGNGTVYRVEIHPSHYHFESHTTHIPVRFALKEIPTNEVDAYYQELSALEKAFPQIQKEKHLIKLLLTFQHGRKYYFLFEWADGNLEEYWKKFPEVPEHSIEQSIWMAQQCWGLATAVKRIHGLATWQREQRERRNDPSFLPVLSEKEKEWGRHGDIKPNNILWFSSHGSEGGLFVLSDLGLTRYHSSLTRSRVSPTSIDGCTEVYRPPEMDMPGQHICSKYDIWSLGCVFLELCTWWLGGFSSVKEFENQRAPEPGRIIEEPKYFFIPEQTHDAQAQLKPVVVEWIKKLRSVAKDDLFAGPMLDLIEKDMLVVGKHQRSAIDRVCAEISKIIEQLPSPTSISVTSYPVSLTSAGYSVSTNSNDLGDDESDKSYNPGLVNRYENDRKTTTSLMVETLVRHTDGCWDPGSPRSRLRLAVANSSRPSNKDVELTDSGSD